MSKNEQIQNKNIVLLVIVSKILASTVYFFALNLFSESLFNYVDLNNYAKCDQLISNILYTKFLCITGLNSHEGIASLKAILIALTINITSCVLFVLTLKSYLTKRLLLLFIFFIAFHPYLAIYSLRLYSDIFGLLGISIITFFIMSERKTGILFSILSMILVNLRTALFPVFLIYVSLKIISANTQKYTKIFMSLLLLLLLINLQVYLDFVERFAIQGNAYNNIFLNPIFLLTLREGAANNGIGTLFINGIGLGLSQVLASLFLGMIHIIGLFKFIQFCLKENKALLVVLIYLIPPMFVVAHLRYLYPIIPLLMFGLCIFIQKKYPLT